MPVAEIALFVSHLTLHTGNALVGVGRTGKLLKILLTK